MPLSKTVIDTLAKEYEDLRRQINDKERSAAQLRAEAEELRETAESIRTLLGRERLPDEIKDSPLAGGPTLEDLEGMTVWDVLREVLRHASRPVKPREVTEYLTGIGFEFGGKSRPGLRVANDLSSMKKGGHVLKTPEGYLLADKDAKT